MSDQMKVIEITIRVMDVGEGDAYEQDSNYEPQTVSLSYELEETGMDEDGVYAEADEITDTIHRIVNT